MKDLEFGAFDPAQRLEQIETASVKGDRVMCGWIPPDKRDAVQTLDHGKRVRAMPKFTMRNAAPLKERRYPLWAAGKKVLGRHIPYSLQSSGSCVASNGHNNILTLQCVEINQGEREEFKWLWWLFNYGCSRQRGGLRGRGEGSFGSSYAESAINDGFFEHDPKGERDLPDPTPRGNMMQLPGSVEMDWSDGAAIGENWRKLGRVHLIKTVSPIRSTTDAVTALSNGYPITIASMFGISPMVPKAVGTPPVRLVTSWSATWAHQQWIDEFFEHPEFGPIFRWGNDWGDDAHGSPTGEEPPGGFYTTEKVLAQVLKSRDTEAYAFSGFDGFEGRKIELDFSAF